MNRRKKLAVKSMHPMDLYWQAMNENCDVSLVELIDRQQRKEGIRLYPEGRIDAEDDGAIPIRLRVTNTAVDARSGQPEIPIQLGSDCLSLWVIGMSECMEWLLKTVAEDQHLSASEAAERVNAVSTKGFDITVQVVEGNVYVQFFPEGSAKWKVPIWGAIEFVKRSLDAVSELGWKIAGTEEQMQCVEKFADADCSDIWEIKQ